MKIISLVNKKNIGDDNAAIAVAGRLHAARPDSEINEVNVADISSIEDGSVVIASGSHMLGPLQNLKKSAPHIFICFCAHQIPAELSAGTDYLDVVALPNHVLELAKNDENQRKIIENIGEEKLVRTNGVAHNLTVGVVEEAYKQKQNEIPEAEKQIFLILGGDANLKGNEWKYYTAEEARIAGEKMAKLLKDFDEKDQKFALLATNGPRTGRFNLDDGSELNTHRLVDGSEYKIDPVSSAFLEALKNSGITEDRYKFYDFIHGQTSAYQALLGASIKRAGSIAIVAGESTSMISECCDLMPAGAVYVLSNGAMNENHQAHVKSVVESGAAVEFVDVSSIREINAENKIESAAAKIAAKIDQELLKNFPEKPSAKKLLEADQVKTI